MSEGLVQRSSWALHCNNPRLDADVNVLRNIDDLMSVKDLNINSFTVLKTKKQDGL